MGTHWIRRPRTLWIAFVVWLALGLGYFATLAAKQYDPGPAAEAPVDWPQAAGLGPFPGRATLVMFAHPQCPCTRSSLEELARLVARTGGRLDAHVVFLKPEEFPDGREHDGWGHSDLWNSAAAMPGVRVWSDPGGRIIGRFGAYVSGETLVYGPSGRLVFTGGITNGRGHAGDNPGLDILENLAAQGFPARESVARAPVFGCSLITPHA